MIDMYLAPGWQAMLPLRSISRLAAWFMHCPWSWLAQPMIRGFMRCYSISLAEAAESDPRRYRSFNAFFTRSPAPGVRPWQGEKAEDLCVPCDGVVSQAGPIQAGRILQAKQREYTTLELIGGDPDLAASVSGGHFVTLYLSPRDFHLVYAPSRLRLQRAIRIPGGLFPVGPGNVGSVDRLFCRNERLAMEFSCSFGTMILVLVGAMMVGGIRPVWGNSAHSGSRRIERQDFPGEGLAFAPGDELARFEFGSTAILLLPPGAPPLMPGFQAGRTVRLGEKLAISRAERGRL